MKKLNLGCGEKKIQGYINVDCRPECGPDQLYDVRVLPYNDGEVDEIRAYDLLEHFGRNETLLVLKEWNRVLKKGGKLTIKCPNITLIASAYLKGAINGLECARLLYGNQEDDNPANFHKNGFDEETIKLFLEETGFKIKKREWFPPTSGDWKNFLVVAEKCE